MSLEAYDWEAVVVGFWNRAILTPAGIAQRLLGLKDATPILVEVPLDGLAPYRVKYEKLTIVASAVRLSIETDTPTFELLERAKLTAVRAIEDLPQTPLTAAGFNIRVRIADPPSSLVTAIAAPLDTSISDAGLIIETRTIERSLKYEDGLLNLSVSHGTDFKVQFNFHRQSSKKEDLVAWLRRPIDEVREIVEKVCETVIQTPLGEVGK